MLKVFSTYNEIEDYIIENEAFILVYKDYVYDFTDYVEKHPG